MPLIPIKLVNPIKSFLKDVAENNKQHLDAAKAFADAYANYASAAMAGPSTPIFTGAEKALMMTTLMGALSPQGQAMTFAMAIQNAVMAYWTAPPVMFAPAPHPGMCLVMPGAAMIGPGIAGALANLKNTYDSIANQMATIIDAATKTALVTFIVPPPIPPPPPPMPLI
jgi:hypothetical protein